MPNRLAQETSPYLQQHADNPVDWFPWGAEALAEAKRTGKPILLSVGYSACHWCHVMAHESFEDPATAAVMNELFVNVKVDREERPDIDQVYQVAQALLTQRGGGWPLTMFLTPEQVPFFGGTYFPDKPRYGMPAFADLLRRVREFHDANPDGIREAGEQLAATLARLEPRAEGAAVPGREALDEAADELMQSFDHEHGGFTGAPKFPHVEMIELLLRRHGRDARDEEALRMATFTLRRMAEGGIHDQVGGGFARYSTDDAWAIPHFEKMLYDNGWLLRAYADAHAASGDATFAAACHELVGWVQREMVSPDGAFYSSLDADSEGEEGRFYVWHVEEIAKVLEPDELAVASIVFGLDQPPNFEGHAWHLTIARPVAEAARAMEVNEGEVRRLLDAARRKLRAAREERVRPGRDEKVLVSWNALMIVGLARASRVLGQPEWRDTARAALDFIHARMWNGGRMHATFKDGRAHLDAYLDDYACLLSALLEMLQGDFRAADLAWATEVGDAILERFEDPDAGGFFFTAHDHERLIHRPKPGPDNATPSGNGVAALALQRLSHLTGEAKYARAAERTLVLFAPGITRRPSAHGSLLAALDEYLEPPRLAIVTGGDAQGFDPWRALLDKAYRPGLVSLFIPGDTAGLPAPLARPASAQVNAWLCQGVTCLPPLDTIAKLREALEFPTMPVDRSNPLHGAH
jgi:uncharacterized protein YyaL (SSP411 family)